MQRTNYSTRIVLFYVNIVMALNEKSMGGVKAAHAF